MTAPKRNKIKVLFVDSVDDAITRNRHQLLSAHPKLKNYEFDYCYAKTFSEEEQAGLEVGIAPDFSLSEEALFGVIDYKIRSFHPHFVLLHTGFVFRRFPSVFVAVFAKLKRSSPECRFGLQPREGLSVDQAAFDKTEGVIELQNLIFKEALNL
jgi:hypothetical protein